MPCTPRSNDSPCYDNPLRIGIHTSRAKSLEESALEAHRLGANTFQIFSASPRMWRASTPDPNDIRRLAAARERLDLKPLVIHTNYLVNLATLDPEIRTKSITSFRGELDRAKAIGADYLVVHPGNYKNQSLEQGLAAFALGLAEAAAEFSAPSLTVLLENTVGGGTKIGQRFEEIRMIRDLAARETDLAIGYCLDTCHLLAAGFNIVETAGLEATVTSAESILGLDNVKVFHANDSKGALGSHLDRHENIGKGQIGEVGFARILTHPKLRDKPFILETPREDDALGRADIDALKRLSQIPR
jgi:deoxyribonuclease-4